MLEKEMLKVLDSDFDKFRDALLKHFEKMCEGKSRLFIVNNLVKDDVSNIYLNSIPKENNPIFRVRGFFDCQNCLHFIRTFSSIVAINKDYNLESIWDFNCGIEYFDNVTKELSKYVHDAAKKYKIYNVFLYNSKKMGVEKNHEHNEDGCDFDWEHLYLNIPSCAYFNGDLNGTLNIARTKKLVLENSLNTISVKACDIILELIASESLY